MAKSVLKSANSRPHKDELDIYRLFRRRVVGLHVFTEEHLSRSPRHHTRFQRQQVSPAGTRLTTSRWAAEAWGLMLECCGRFLHASTDQPSGNKLCYAKYPTSHLHESHSKTSGHIIPPYLVSSACASHLATPSSPQPPQQRLCLDGTVTPTLHPLSSASVFTWHPPSGIQSTRTHITRHTVSVTKNCRPHTLPAVAGR
jgi:hypothetical protein